VPRLDAPVDQAGRTGKGQGRLRNVVARIIENHSSKLFTLLRGALRAYEHAVAARLANGLDDHVLQIREDVLAVGSVRHEERGDVWKNRVFVQVIADDFRDVSVDRFVVGDAGADGISESDVPGTVGVEETGHAKCRIRAEAERIEEVVIDSAVDDVDAAQARGGAHIDDVVVREEVAALDELDSHLLSEERVLEISGVGDTRREQDRSGILAIRAVIRNQRTERGKQLAGVMIDRPDAVVTEERRENTLENLAIRDHVRNAAGDAKIVFKDSESAVGKADEIGAADADVDVARNVESAHLAAEVLAAVDKIARNDFVRQDAPFVIHVAQEKIEGGKPLGKSFFDFGPLARGDNPREEVVREDAFGAFLAAVNGEGDAFVQESEVRGLLAAAQFFRRKIEEGLVKGAIVFARDTGRGNISS